MAAIASYLTVLLGAPAPSAAQLAAWPSIGVVFLLHMLVPGLGVRGKNPVGGAMPSTNWNWGSHAYGPCCRSG